MKYSVFSVSMPEYTPEETVKVLKEIGYDAVEWRVKEIPQDPPKDTPYAFRYWGDNKSTLDLEKIVEIAPDIKKLCDDNGLEIAGLTTYLTPSDKDKVEPVLKAAQIMGTKMVRVFPPKYPDENGKTWPELWEEMYGNVRELEKLAKQYGVKIVFEIHMDCMLASPSAAHALLEGTDPDALGLIYDPGNMVNEGFEDYQKSFEMLGKHIAHVHVKNGILTPDGRDEFGSMKWTRKWVSLPEGMADLKKVFEVLAKNQYQGYISVEDFSNEMPTKEKLVKALEYMKKLAESAGLE